MGLNPVAATGGTNTVTESILEGPTTVILQALAAKARGEEYDEDAVEEAAFLIATANLIAGGMSEERAYHHMIAIRLGQTSAHLGELGVYVNQLMARLEL
jgi:hypothetical protein